MASPASVTQSVPVSCSGVTKKSCATFCSSVMVPRIRSATEESDIAGTVVTGTGATGATVPGIATPSGSWPRPQLESATDAPARPSTPRISLRVSSFFAISPLTSPLARIRATAEASPLSSRSILTHAELRKRERVTLDW